MNIGKYSETCLNRYSFGPKKIIGLDRLTFTALGSIVYKNLKYLHSTKHVSYKQNRESTKGYYK